MLSFIVPAYNEELELPSTIAAIKFAAGQVRQADGLVLWRDREYEIIVADDGSTDRSAEIANEAGARVISIKRRQIAAARNAGAALARGDVLFFVDADTRINAKHIVDALAALAAGCSGGGARIVTDGFVPMWGNVCLKLFCAVYFGMGLGAGAFLFTSRENFEAVGHFDEQLFIGEEIYFSLALKKLGRFKILRQPVQTSARKLRMYSAWHIISRSLAIIFGGKRSAYSRKKLGVWYDGKRETRSA